MDPFWMKNNRRIGKLLDRKGMSESWKVVDKYIDVEGLPDPAGVAATIGPHLESTMLGEVITVRADSVRVATTGGTRSIYAGQLIIAHLRALQVPAGVLLRWGFPTPYAATRVYRTERDTNLEVIGRSRRKKPAAGDVFAYSFDKKRFFWGQVVQDDLSYMGATTLVIFFKTGTGSLADLPTPESDDLLDSPLAIDARAWRRGYFFTAGNLPVRPGRFEWSGWTPTWNLDVTLSIAHGIPCIAPP